MHFTRDAYTYVYKINRSRCARVYEPSKILDLHTLRGRLKTPQICKNPAFHLFSHIHHQPTDDQTATFGIKSEIKIQVWCFWALARACGARTLVY